MPYAIRRNATGSWLARAFYEGTCQSPKWVVGPRASLATFETEAEVVAVVLAMDLEDAEGVEGSYPEAHRPDGVTIVEVEALTCRTRDHRGGLRHSGDRRGRRVTEDDGPFVIVDSHDDAAATTWYLRGFSNEPPHGPNHYRFSWTRSAVEALPLSLEEVVAVYFELDQERKHENIGKLSVVPWADV